MSVASIGVGSGLDLSGLVTQLLEAERAPKQARLDAREEDLETVISAIGSLKSKMNEFKDSVDELRSDFELNGRKASTSHPDVDEGESGPFTAEASNSATAGEYKIIVDELASGSRITSADGDFAATDTEVSAAGGALTFKTGVAGQTFDVNVTSGMTLTELKNAVNKANSDFMEANPKSEFEVNASIIDTGTATGAKIVFSSSVTGDGNDLQIVNTTDDADLNKIATLNSSESTSLTNVSVQAASNAKASIDGILVESDSNTFENVIENVSFEVSEISSVDAAGDKQASTLNIGFDKDGLKNKITDFVDNYNTLISEVGTLTRYGNSELEKDGALAGDFMLRSIQQGLSTILSSSVDASSLKSLFQIGVSFDDDGKLEISASDEFGFGSGEERLDDALSDNYDEIAKLFSDDQGIANKLYDYIKEYTTFGGLIPSREQSYKDQKDSLGDERSRFELQMSGYETLLRNKYINLDLTVSRLQRTGGALLSSLGA